MSRDEKVSHLASLLRSLWLAPLFGTLSMIALLAWGLVSHQVTVVMMALSVIAVTAVGWAVSSAGGRAQLQRVR